MDKIRIALITFIAMFALFGCTTKETLNKSKNNNTGAPAGLKEVTGKIVKAELNNDENVVIKKEDITNNMIYISYEFEEVSIGLIAVRDSQGNPRVVINTCQSCGGSPYAYFVQVGNRIQCQNCGSTFAIDDLDDLIDEGCNPIEIEELKEEKDVIIVGTKQLKEIKDKFENWKGPNA